MRAPVWKMALLTWIGLWPTVTVVMWTVRPQIAGLPVAVQTFLMTGLIVPTMAWVHMPLLTRLFRGWLIAGPRVEPDESVPGRPAPR